jgi:hypothetical protein
MIDDNGEAVHIQTKQHRELSSSSVVRNPKLIAGTPFDLQVPTRSGDLETLHLVQGITAVKTDWLVELAPELFAARRGKAFYDPRSGSLATRSQVRFGGQVLEGQSEAITDSNPENRKLFVDSFASWAYEQLERERRSYAKYHTKRVPAVPLRQLQQQVKALANGATSLDDLSPQQKSNLIELTKLHTHLGGDFMAQLGASHSATRRRNERQQRGWQPRHKRKYDRRQR